MKFFEGLTLLLVGLKLTNLIAISWWLVIAPLVWQWVVAPIFIGVIIGMAASIIDTTNGDHKMSDAIMASFINNCIGNKTSKSK